VWYYWKQSLPKYYLDLDEGILECGPCSLTLRYKATILMYDITENQTFGSSWLNNTNKFPLGVCWCITCNAWANFLKWPLYAGNLHQIPHLSTDNNVFHYACTYSRLPTKDFVVVVQIKETYHAMFMIKASVKFNECMWVRFSKLPKLFRWYKFLCIFNKNSFQALKFGSYFAFPYILYIIY